MSEWYWRPSFFSSKVKPSEEKPKQKLFLGADDKKGTLEYQYPPDDEHLETFKLTPERIGSVDNE